jgi:hypothetical protein
MLVENLINVGSLGSATRMYSRAVLALGFRV